MNHCRIPGEVLQIIRQMSLPSSFYPFTRMLVCDLRIDSAITLWGADEIVLVPIGTYSETRKPAAAWIKGRGNVALLDFLKTHFCRIIQQRRDYNVESNMNDNNLPRPPQGRGRLKAPIYVFTCLVSKIYRGKGKKTTFPSKTVLCARCSCGK